MATRLLMGRRPDGAETGFWVSKPDYDAINDDRTDRNKFRFSSSFQGRRPLRIVAAGISQTRAVIACPDIGGEPIFAYRLMVNGSAERLNKYYGSGQDGSGGSYSATETYNRCTGSGSGRYFSVYVTQDENAVYPLRYLIAVF